MQTIFTDGKQILDHYLDKYSKELEHGKFKSYWSTIRKSLFPYLEKYHKHVINMMEKMIMNKSMTANIVLAEIIQPHKNEPIDNAWPIVRGECIIYSPWKSISAVRDIMRGYQTHVETMLKINSEHIRGKLAHLIPYNFTPFVHPEIMTNLNGMTNHDAHESVKQVGHKILMDFKEHYNLIVNRFNEIEKEIEKLKELETSQKSKTTDTGISKAMGKNDKSAELEESKLPEKKMIKICKKGKCPVFKLAESAMKKIKFNKNSNEKPNEKPNEKANENSNEQLQTIDFVPIEADINKRFNKLLTDLNVDGKKHSETEIQLTFKKWLDIKNKLDEFTDDVNKIGTKWMAPIYDYLLNVIDEKRVFNL